MYYNSSTNYSDCCPTLPSVNQHQPSPHEMNTHQKMCYKMCSKLSVSSRVAYASIQCALLSNSQHRSKRQQIKLTPVPVKIVIVQYLLHHEYHIYSTLNKQTNISVQNHCDSHRKLLLIDDLCTGVTYFQTIRFLLKKRQLTKFKVYISKVSPYNEHKQS